MPSDTRPKLRSLEIIPFESRGQEMLLLRDRLGIASDASIPRNLAPLLDLLDGTNTPAELIRLHFNNSGENLPLRFVERIIAELDEAYLLASSRFAAKRQATVEAYINMPSRPAILAGGSYPSEPRRLAERLDGYFQEAAILDGAASARTAPLAGIVVPHIDFARGGPVEAMAYERLRGGSFDTMVILGIAHCGVRYPFCVAPKDFETPLGTARLDREFVAALEEKIGPRLTAEQFAHKNEHSVEFVTVFLQYMPEFRDAAIVPIICGGFHDIMRRGISPLADPEVAEFVSVLRDTVLLAREAGKRVGLIASVDLSHVGSRFGDDTPLTPDLLGFIESADREFLECVERGDSNELHCKLARDDNARNVDAHSAVFALLAAFPEIRGQLLHYAQAYDAPANSVVSFASMALYWG